MLHLLQKYISYYCIFIGLYGFAITCCCVLGAKDYSLYLQMFTNAMNNGFQFVAVLTFGIVFKEKLMEKNPKVDKVDTKGEDSSAS
ncbi:hypothetical protein [Candidatus Uabimicrobium amorphum]|uniref:Uncharacterized protein n=1 Tax=Uabimicrobium amorphum TaxID=2596890 RepID=A0A5S9IQ74_UABAM|nr:hypothetical protein [Candidatus Uabimicrobium amorphum]BBM85432.1 hypothetical protein UABAM_03799 [Candidatus Uabimicrobium amorphum]